MVEVGAEDHDFIGNVGVAARDRRQQPARRQRDTLCMDEVARVVALGDPGTTSIRVDVPTITDETITDPVELRRELRRGLVLRDGDGLIVVEVKQARDFARALSHLTDLARTGEGNLLEAAGSDLDRVVKMTVFMADLGDFQRMNGVYAEFFPEAPPARSIRWMLFDSELTT